jgi:hypothetical protein
MRVAAALLLLPLLTTALMRGDAQEQSTSCPGNCCTEHQSALPTQT